MSIATMTISERGTLSIAGPLTFDTVTALSRAGLPASDRPAGDVIYDLGDVTQVDSAGLALLADWISDAKAAQRVVRFENVPQRLDQLATIAGVGHWFSA